MGFMYTVEEAPVDFCLSLSGEIIPFFSSGQRRKL